MGNEIKLYENAGAVARVDGDNYIVTAPNGASVTLNRSHKDEQGNDLGDGDFGVIPGTHKPSLFKSGADKIRIAYGFFERHSPVTELCVVDWEKGFMRYVDKCELVKLNPATGQEYVFASYVAAANNTEKRNGKMGTLSMTVDNNNVKIAQKRSMVSAVISVANMSDLFTMDVEDSTLDKAFSSVIKSMDNEPISMAQNKKLWAEAGAAKLKKEDVIEKLQSVGYKSSKDVMKKDFGKVLDLISGNITCEQFKELVSQKESGEQA